jgi:flagellar FliL protein
MANDKELQLNVEEEDGGGGGKKKIIIIIVAVILVVAIAAGAAIFFLGGDSSEAVEETETAEAPETTEASKGPAIYVKMKPEFIINYQVGPRQRYMQIHMEGLTYDGEIAGALQMHSPMIRSAIINLLSSQEFKMMRTAEGRATLRTDLVVEVNRLLTQETGIENGLDQILFTNFVIQ